MVKKRGLPVVGELVICKVNNINPHSAFLFMIEYEKEGMVNISEISGGWVRDIRQHIKTGQMVVAKVLKVDERNVNLSLKRVDKKQKNDKMKEYKLNLRAEKMLEIAAGELNRSLDKAYEEIGFKLQESFGSLYDAFKTAVINPELLEKRGIPKDWAGVIKDIAEKNIEQKDYEFKARMIMRSYEPNGISIIKNNLKKAEAMKLEVKYIAAPEYLLKYRTNIAKKGKKEFLTKIEELKKLGAEIEVIK